LTIVSCWSLNSTKVGMTLLRFRSSQSTTNPRDNTTKELHVLSHGVGYTAGTISLQGYPGQTDGASTSGSATSDSFSATYQVGILAWDFYYDANSQPRKGSNYTWRNMTTFHGPALVSAADANGMAENTTRIHVDRCWRNSSAVSHDGLVSAHMGEVVVGCAPNIQFDVVDGQVSVITFDNSSCRASGLTCRLVMISVDGHGGAGFSGYFTTGISQVSLITAGQGYVCDWACFLSLHSTGTGAEQACLITSPTCANTVSSHALVIFGDLARIVSFLLRACATLVSSLVFKCLIDVSVQMFYQPAGMNVLPI